MRWADRLSFCLQSLLSQRLRTALIVLSTAFGTAGVVLLTWLGEGARLYVVDQFNALGTNLVIVFPGRNETVGGAPPILGTTSRDLTLGDAQAVLRSPAVLRLAPIVVGGATVGHGGRERETTVLGSTADLLPVRHLVLGSGSFLPAGDAASGGAVCVLGTTVKQELFGSQSPLGEFVRLGNRRYRVAGVLASEGMSLGTNLDEMVVLPVGAAQALFNSPGLLRIIIEAKSREAVAQVVTDTERIITERHEGENDVTVVTQDAIASGFDGVLRALTMAVAGIGAISLVVAGILIMNVMVVAVTQRRSEVGLLKALGAERPTIRGLFLGEALLLSLGGSLLGLLLGEGCSRLVPRFVPMLQPGVPAWAAVMALVTAVLFGVVFGISPAVRAARLDPVLALARR